MASETLRREGRLSANPIAKRLGIAKSTLDSCLRHRDVATGPYPKKRQQKVI